MNFVKGLEKPWKLTIPYAILWKVFDSSQEAIP